MTELALWKMAHEVAQGAIFPKGAIPPVPPLWFTYRDSGAFVSVPPGAEGSFASFLISAPSATDTNHTETSCLTWGGAFRW